MCQSDIFYIVHIDENSFIDLDCNHLYFFYPGTEFYKI